VSSPVLHAMIRATRRQCWGVLWPSRSIGSCALRTGLALRHIAVAIDHGFRIAPSEEMRLKSILQLTPHTFAPRRMKKRDERKRTFVTLYYEIYSDRSISYLTGMTASAALITSSSLCALQ
jgi:hypothetical protein